MVPVDLYSIFKQFNTMLFTKSSTDLGKNEVEHRVLCDWLRNINQQNIQLSRKLTILQKSVDLILENESSADNMAKDFDNSSDSGAVS